MLERLADLIRDRVFWKPRFPRSRAPPVRSRAGLHDRAGHDVAGRLLREEFAGILRALGYRSETRTVTPKATAPEALLPRRRPLPPSLRDGMSRR